MAPVDNVEACPESRRMSPNAVATGAEPLRRRGSEEDRSFVGAAAEVGERGKRGEGSGAW